MKNFANVAKNIVVFLPVILWWANWIQQGLDQQPKVTLPQTGK